MTPDTETNKAFSERMRARFKAEFPDRMPPDEPDALEEAADGYPLRPGGLREVFKAVDAGQNDGSQGQAG